MKIAIFAPYATVAPHFETDLELGQKHLDAGDEVTFVSCDGQLANCDFNNDRSADRCANCRGRREHGFELLTGKFKTVPLHSGKHATPEFKSLQQLIEYKVDGFDVGYAALSSLVSICRDPEPDLVQQAELLNKFIDSAMTTYRQTIEFIDRNRPDRIYVFNGRFAAMRAVLRACQQQQVECCLHERGCDLNHYDLYENHMPHNIANIDSVIRKLWAAADPTERESLGAAWFEDRIKRVERSWHSFTKDQQAGRLPPGFESGKRNIAIFSSSDDEFVAIGDAWKNTLYPDQVEAVSSIASSMLLESPETQLYLRVHPNVKDVEYNRKRQMLALDFPNLSIISPDDTVDTYALMQASRTIVSFGSSVGIEAVYGGKPSVLLGPCLYQDLGGPVRSRAHSETIDLLNRDMEPATDRTGALMYGHWLQTRGYRFEYFEAESLFEGKFRGQVVHDREAAKQLAKNSRQKRNVFSLFR